MDFDLMIRCDMERSMSGYFLIIENIKRDR